MNDIWQQRMGESEIRENDVRSEWDRDYARIIHSSAFRRLQAKTQVLGLGESDFYRTRLTHSLEVAQIGAGICSFLKEKYKGVSEIHDWMPTAGLMGAICLAHDIGHPPFGHGGEVALNVCMRDSGGFEGNGQTLRILSKLEKYSAENGLNPTRRTLLGVLKYPVRYSVAVNPDFYKEIPTEKPTWLFKASEQKPPKCYHDAEDDIVRWILKPLKDDIKDFTESLCQEGKHNKPVHKGLDTSIMELADDISYGLHDLEDAISLQMIDFEKWKEFNSGCEEIFSLCGKSSEEIGERLFKKESYDRKNCIGELVNLMITNTTVVLSKMPASSHSLLRYNAELAENFSRLRTHLFRLVKLYVIENVNVQHLEFKGQRMVVELFEVLASDPYRLLPERTRRKYREENDNIRVICDFVAGMTDDYATRLYDKIFSSGKGSIFDKL